MLTLRDRLKAATADEHDRVEAQLAAASSGASSAAYIDYLTSSYFYYAAVEPLLQENAALLAVGIDMRARAKLAWLEQDLRHFGSVPPRARDPAVPLTRQSELAEALGCAYVLEGATLGGAILYSRIKRTLGVHKDDGARFLYGYGADTARMWNAFVRALNAIVLSELDEARCIAAARRTFTSIGEWYATTLESPAFR